MNGRSSSARIRRPSAEHLRQYLSQPDLKIAAHNVLANLYQPQYISRSSARSTRPSTIYKVFQRAPGLVAETDVTFKAYVDPADAEVLGQELAAEKFYRYGPRASTARTTPTVAPSRCSRTS